MFSGIRYILGYSDETATQAASEQSATSVPGGNSNVTVPKATDSSSANKLEQTLNAATTKFTEQLLPLQASIEELQTSSHQLLPSITEQHEEDELKKKVATCDEPVLADVANDQVDDDNDAFNEDSWELLDLVEKAEDVLASVGLNSSVQVNDTTTSTSQQGHGKSPNGILKSQSSCDQNENNDGSQKRQKPKVSFGQSELVKSKQGETEHTNLNETEGSGSGVVKGAKKSGSVGDIECQKVPTLNYAKALSNKLATEAILDVLEGDALYPGAGPSKSKQMEASCIRLPVKRVRVASVSCSGWSSNEDEAGEEEGGSVEKVINAEVSAKKKVNGSTASVEAKVAINAEDNESIASSDFSDCDYGFGGVNDYIMRPRKTSSKRGRTISASSSSSNRKSGKSERKVTAAKAKLMSAIEAKNGSESTENKDSKADSCRSTKPNKKRMIMTVSSKSVCLTDFLKNKAGGSFSGEALGQGGQKLAPELVNQQVTKQQQQQHPTVNGWSTESSDIAEMDESWFVTPPPCFTKAVKVNDNSNLKVESPEAKEDDQENALIENPSIYIANKSSRLITKAKKLKPIGMAKGGKCTPGEISVGGSPMKLEDDSMESRQGKEEVKFDGKQQQQQQTAVPKGDSLEASDKDATSSGKDADVSGFDTSDQLGNLITRANSKSINKHKAHKSIGKVQAKPASIVVKRTDNKAWRNKFIVDAWDLDDDDFDSDFDHMVFEPTKKRKASKTKKGQQKQAKIKDDVDDSLSAGSNEVASFDYTSTSSVELLSVKSLATSDIEVHGDQQTQVESNAENCRPPDELEQNLSQSPKKDVEHRRAPTQVRPIEPERVPGWQLKRQRSKRRPLVSVAVVNKQQAAPRSSAGSPKTLQTKNVESSSSASSSSRSTPTLIDRIGCSIVANLTNLTSGFVSSGAMNYCNPNGQANIMEGAEKRVVKRSNMNEPSAQFARKQLSRGSMRRQNICAKQGNSLRRPDRRLKLFATPNGCSINRKVHTNIH